MKTEVNILNLRGNLAAIREYANTIASMSAAATNAYVMAFDKDNEILWTVQADEDLDEVKATINWQGVRRVEIYDHSGDGTYKVEYVYITSKKSLDAYTAERSAADFRVVENRTQYEAIFCEEENSDTQSDDSDTQSDDNDTRSEDNGAQSDDSDEVEPTAAEPSRLAQMAEKVAEKAKTFATRAAFMLALVAVCVLSFATAVAVASAFAAGFRAAGCGDSLSFVLLLCAFVPASDVALWLECNALAVVARIFPHMFTGSRPEFLAPGSFYWHVYRSNI